MGKKNNKKKKTGGLRKKKMDSNPQQWVDEQLRVLNISIFNYSAMEGEGGGAADP